MPQLSPICSSLTVKKLENKEESIQNNDACYLVHMMLHCTVEVTALKGQDAKLWSISPVYLA